MERALDFAAKFCVSLYDKQDNGEDQDGDDEDMPPFLKKKSLIFFFRYIRPGARIFGSQSANLSVKY